MAVETIDSCLQEVTLPELRWQTVSHPESELPIQVVGYSRPLDEDAYKRIDNLPDNEFVVLPVLHLNAEERKKYSSTTLWGLYKSVDRAAARLGHRNRVDLAMFALRGGVHFLDVRTPVDRESLDRQELEVAARLRQSNTEIAQAIGRTERTVVRSLASFKEKTGARTRIEAALMVRIFDLIQDQSS